MMCPECGEDIYKPQLSNHIGSKSCKQNQLTYGKINTTEKCDYGCENVANFRFKNGKLCCSKNVAKCPSLSSKISQSTKGREAWNKGKSHSSNRKGKSYEEIYGEDRASKVRQKISNTQVGKEIAESTKKKIAESLRQNPDAGGHRKNGGIGKGCWYESHIAGEVFLDSSYELELAKLWDSKGKNWERNTDSFEYEYEGKSKKYIPDFYLPEDEMYVEVKGFKTKQDEAKWRNFPYDLQVLYKEDLRELGCEL